MNKILLWVIHAKVFNYTACFHWKKKKSFWPKKLSHWRNWNSTTDSEKLENIFESNWLDIESQIWHKVTQLFRSKWLNFFFQCSIFLHSSSISIRIGSCIYKPGSLFQINVIFSRLKIEKCLLPRKGIKIE